MIMHFKKRMNSCFGNRKLFDFKSEEMHVIDGVFLSGTGTILFRYHNLLNENWGHSVRLFSFSIMYFRHPYSESFLSSVEST
jgi:hypothetical protein